MAIPMYFASLEAAWLSEGVPGLGQALVDAGWERLPWPRTTTGAASGWIGSIQTTKLPRTYWRD